MVLLFIALFEGFYIALLQNKVLYYICLSMYTQELINEWMTCPKIVTEGWRDIKDARHGVKKVICMSSADGKYEFTAFFTQNAFFKEDFSIGLVFVSKTEDGKILLIRCNGLHGPTTAWGHHAYTHTHKPTVEGLNEGNKQPTLIERVDAYTTLEGGLHYFGNLINLKAEHKQKYFPTPNIQPELFNDHNNDG